MNSSTENCNNVPTGIKRWKDKFPEDFFEWKYKFSLIYRSSRDDKLRQFSFKLHRIIVTKKTQKLRFVQWNSIYFLRNPDSIEHAFSACNVTSHLFFSDAFAWFDQAHNSDFYFSSKQTTFNDIIGTTASQVPDPPINHSLHLFIIYLEHYIYNWKRLERKPYIQEFRRKVLLQWQMEKCALLSRLSSMLVNIVYYIVNIRHNILKRQVKL